MTAIAFDRTDSRRRASQGPGAEWNRVTPRSAALSWLVTTLQALARLARLPNNWDGYGSPPIQPAALASAHRFIAAVEALPLPLPSVAPVTGGGIGFTWQLENRELEIEVLPDGTTQYLMAVKDPKTGEEATHADSLPLDRSEYVQHLAEWLMAG